MKVSQRVKIDGQWTGDELSPATQLVLVFGSTPVLSDPATWSELTALYPAARIAACSTAGEIAGVRVFDDTLVATSIALEHGHVAAARIELAEAADSTALGALLASRLPREGLVHVVVLSDGLGVNGSALVAGMTSKLGPRVALTGGLAADGPRFAHTTVCLDAPAPAQQVVAIGFYGDRLHIGCGSLGGWDPFGPERRVTRATGNVLYELDGEPALDLYKRYLGDQAASLPASGLLYPLTIRSETNPNEAVVRTLLSVNEADRSLTFAGDIPLGCRARLMSANFERLVDGASGAALTSTRRCGDHGVELALLVSCVGRRLVLKQRIEEEVEAVSEVLGNAVVMTGFYSYGEISPGVTTGSCELHNQTMTVTTFSER
jgi:hypothetical protein